MENSEVLKRTDGGRSTRSMLLPQFPQLWLLLLRIGAIVPDQVHGIVLSDAG